MSDLTDRLTSDNPSNIRDRFAAADRIHELEAEVEDLHQANAAYMQGIEQKADRIDELEAELRDERWLTKKLVQERTAKEALDE